MKTSELIGPALNWAVAKCEGWNNLRRNPHKFNPCLLMTNAAGNNEQLADLDYSTDWAQGGPIIERENFSVRPFFCDGTIDGWSACGHMLEYDENGEFIEGSDFAQDGPTPLIAAMRCYCCAKLGEFVEIPEELCQQENS